MGNIRSVYHALVPSMKAISDNKGTPSDKGFNSFAFVVRTGVNETTNQHFDYSWRGNCNTIALYIPKHIFFLISLSLPPLAKFIARYQVHLGLPMLANWSSVSKPGKVGSLRPGSLFCV